FRMVSLAARFSPPSTLICPAGNRRRPSESNVSCLTVCATITFSPALQSPGCLQEPYRRQLIIRGALLLNADLPCRRVTKRGKLDLAGWRRVVRRLAITYFCASDRVWVYRFHLIAVFW